MTEPLKHVIRPPLPWRGEVDAMTECGLRADSYPSVSREEASAEWRKLGAQRASLWFCMTCVQTTEGWPTWDEDLRAAWAAKWNGPGSGDVANARTSTGSAQNCLPSRN